MAGALEGQAIFASPQTEVKKSCRPVSKLMSMIGEAIVRGVPNRYEECALVFNERQIIDLEMAKLQHKKYVQALEDAGLRVHQLPPDDKYPDCCFVEDNAVLLDDIGVITWMGAPDRNGEQYLVGEHVKRILDMPTRHMGPPSCLEGGDVLRIGTKLYLGHSTRTNEEGIEFLNGIAKIRGYEVIRIPVDEAIHLKTVVTYLGKNTVLAASGVVEKVRKYIPWIWIIEVPDDISYAANVLRIGNHVLVPEGCNYVRDRISSLGYNVIELDISEFQKGEAGLTCLSLIKMNS